MTLSSLQAPRVILSGFSRSNCWVSLPKKVEVLEMN
jgi:hypothetical protein